LFQLGWYGYCTIHQPGAYYYNLFFEHPPGLWALPMLLFKLGVPSTKTLFFADLLYQIVTSAAVYLLFRKFAGRSMSQWCVVALMLMSISFVHTLRSTHEMPLLMATMLMLVGVAYLRESRFLCPLVICVAAAFATALKGAMAIPPMVLATLSATLMDRSDQALRATFVPSVFVAELCLVGGSISVMIIENGHHNYTGKSFWSAYWQLQISDRAMSHRDIPTIGFDKLMNIGKYLAHVMWYSSPFLITALLSLYLKRNHTSLASSIGSLRLTFRRMKPLVLVCAVGSAMYIIGISMFDRFSMRYIFPAYYLQERHASHQTYTRWPKYFTRLTERLNAPPIFLAALFWATTRSVVIFLNPNLAPFRG
jgi:4-amino-4-deoxy-L-arabinose transferase-like glycosyltransferase